LIIADLRLLADNWVRQQQIRRAKKERQIETMGRTNDWLAIFLYLECTFAVSDQERKIKQVFDGLRKVVGVRDEPE